MELSNSIEVRIVNQTDVDELHQLILERTQRSTRITREQLERDLFQNLSVEKQQEQARETSQDIYDDDICEFDQAGSASNSSVCNALVAELQGPKEKKLVGYLLYNYFWSPWKKPRYVHVIDMFTKQDHQGLGKCAEGEQQENYQSRSACKATTALIVKVLVKNLLAES